jgi:hypothetical protein
VNLLLNTCKNELLINNKDFCDELLFETFNTIAKQKNESGDIESSLQYLLLASELIKHWEKKEDKFKNDI